MTTEIDTLTLLAHIDRKFAEAEAQREAGYKTTHVKIDKAADSIAVLTAEIARHDVRIRNIETGDCGGIDGAHEEIHEAAAAIGRIEVTLGVHDARLGSIESDISNSSDRSTGWRMTLVGSILGSGALIGILKLLTL